MRVCTRRCQHKTHSAAELTRTRSSAVSVIADRTAYEYDVYGIAGKQSNRFRLQTAGTHNTIQRIELMNAPNYTYSGWCGGHKTDKQTKIKSKQTYAIHKITFLNTSSFGGDRNTNPREAWGP